MAVTKPTASAEQLADLVAEDPDLQNEIKQDPVATLQRLAKPLESDVWIYRLVVIILGLTMLGVVAGVFALKVVDQNIAIPDALVAIGSASVAALAGLLAPFPSKS